MPSAKDPYRVAVEITLYNFAFCSALTKLVSVVAKHRVIIKIETRNNKLIHGKLKRLCNR
jgi:hypothetical protein